MFRLSKIRSKSDTIRMKMSQIDPPTKQTSQLIMRSKKRFGYYSFEAKTIITVHEELSKSLTKNGLDTIPLNDKNIYTIYNLKKSESVLFNQKFS